MRVLAIDTSGRIASVAVCDENSVLAETTVVTKLTHSQIIMPIVKKVLEDSQLKFSDIDAFAVANGPGSYTGLRIGVASVKSFAYAMKKNCVGVSTLKSLAYNFFGIDTVVCSVMHARADLVYTAFFRIANGRVERLTDDRIISTEEVVSELENYDEQVYLNGDYADKLIENCNNKNVFLAPIKLKNQSAVSLCQAVLVEKEFTTANELDVSYLQITKAEKDLQLKG